MTHVWQCYVSAGVVALAYGLTGLAVWRARGLIVVSPSVLFVFVAASLGFACALVVAGCGGASPAVRSAYTAEVMRCIANERAIVLRDSTAEEDARDMRAERARCDAALATIEAEGTLVP